MVEWGQFASRWLRSLRLWWLLNQIYGVECHWATALPLTQRLRLFTPGTIAPAAPGNSTQSQLRCIIAGAISGDTTIIPPNLSKAGSW